jgi:hypothetical protein
MLPVLAHLPAQAVLLGKSPRGKAHQTVTSASQEHTSLPRVNQNVWTVLWVNMRAAMVHCPVQVVVLLMTANRVRLHASWQLYITTEHHPDEMQVKLVLKMQTVLGAIKLPLPIKDIGWIDLPITMLIESTPVRGSPV